MYMYLGTRTCTCNLFIKKERQIVSLRACLKVANYVPVLNSISLSFILITSLVQNGSQYMAE